MAFLRPAPATISLALVLAVAATVEIQPDAMEVPPDAKNIIEPALFWWHYDGKGGILPGKGSSGTYVAFQDHVLFEGWGHLHVNAEATREGAYAAGWLEGYMTAVHIFEHYTSWLQAQFGMVSMHAGGFMRNFGGQGEGVRQFLEANDLWVRRKVAKNPTSPYWQTVGRLMAQVDGLLAGQTAATVNTTAMRLERTDLLLLLASGDVYDIQPAVHEGNRVNWAAMDAAHFMKEFHRRVSCSALVTYTKDAVRAGHVTWTSYNNMLRIYKRITWRREGKPVHKVAFSSRPGYLYSKDDFYTLPLQRMIIMETTNAVFNNSLYNKVVPRALLSWQRVPVSNFLAKDGAHWSELMTLHNSGTYNNQWIAITLDRASKAGLQDGFLYIAEQIPGEVKVADVTHLVRRQGYFSSYNIPYDVGIFHKSGYVEQKEKMGDENSYHNCSRAKIFRRDAPGARGSMKAFKRVLGSNNFQTDPLSHGDASKAISARGDLNTDNMPNLYGGVDLKVTEAVPGAASWEGTAWARSGPTTDGQPPFSWLSVPNSEPILHLGQPAIFNFPFVPMPFGDATGISPVGGKRGHSEVRPWLAELMRTEIVRLSEVAPNCAWTFALWTLCMFSIGGLLSFAMRKVKRWQGGGQGEPVYYLHA